MALQHKRTEDEMGKQFDDLFIMPDAIDKDKDKYLKKDDSHK
ncbi:hypothetical protein [Weissella muntiaci]|nr:hypothetical protein [Weissella muntiaci]